MNRSLISILIVSAVIVIPNQDIMKKEAGKENKSKHTLWVLSEIMNRKDGKVKVIGNPSATKCKYGKAVVFNGSTDGLLLQEMPLKDLQEFTVEVILQPQSGGNFEQRYLHLGDVQGDRVLLELRATPTHWYSDAFIKVGEENVTLISPELLHPLDQWYHVAYVNDNGRFTVYVNGKKELEGEKKLPSLKSGSASFGMRQNEVSWFRGAIYEIRITPAALKTGEFLKL
jgi:hypothetical protein